MTIEIAKSKKSELLTLAKIYVEEFSKKPYNEKWTLKKALYKMNFFIQFYDLYSIKYDKEVVGFICVNPNFMCPGEVAFGEEMAIQKKFQNKGIGAQVFRNIFEIYKKRGFKRFVGIAKTHGRAIKLYERLNLKPSKED